VALSVFKTLAPLVVVAVAVVVVVLQHIEFFLWFLWLAQAPFGELRATVAILAQGRLAGALILCMFAPPLP
jgi:hypothetical protein